MSQRYSVTAIGMAWYQREDYKAIKAVMVDSEDLPATCDKWLYLAQKTEKQLKRDGHLVERVYIYLEEFSSWCSARGISMDGKARSAFAREHVDATHRNQS